MIEIVSVDLEAGNLDEQLEAVKVNKDVTIRYVAKFIVHVPKPPALQPSNPGDSPNQKGSV